MSMDYDLNIKVLKALINYMRFCNDNENTEFNDMDVEAVELSIQAIKKLRQIESVECELPNRFCEGEGPFEDGYNRAIDECKPIFKEQALKIEKLKQYITELEPIVNMAMLEDYDEIVDNLKES